MPVNSKVHCLHDLRGRILSLDLAPGAGLDETGMCAEYEISRTPLREILQRLAGEGYVTIEANRGAKVSPMDLFTMRTFFQTAPLIYATISRLAAENRSPSQISALKETQISFAAQAAAGDASAAALSNHRFHSIIGEMARNPYLMVSLARMLIDHTRLSQTFYRPTSPTEKQLVATACEQHDQMISAIEAGDAALAADLTLKHWDLSRDRLERFVSPDPLPLEAISSKERSYAI